MQLLSIIILICAVAEIAFANLTTELPNDLELVTTGKVITIADRKKLKLVTKKIEDSSEATDRMPGTLSPSTSTKLDNLITNTVTYASNAGATSTELIIGATTSELINGATKSELAKVSTTSGSINVASKSEPLVGATTSESIIGATTSGSINDASKSESVVGATTSGSIIGSTISASICRLPKERGPCEVEIPAYYFDYITKKCKKFVYGGCKGNANRFTSLTSCKQACH